MMTSRNAGACLLGLLLLGLMTTPARPALMSLAASGTITLNSSGDGTIPIGTPWSFELRYNTAAPDLDFELTGEPDPTFGRFTNTASPPALMYFHYQSADYNVTLDGPDDFGTFSDVHITFTGIHAIDINIHAVDLFPPLAGGPVSFHADFNAFATAPVLASDGLPADVTLNAQSFDESTITLIPTTGVISSSDLASLTFTAIPATPGDTNGDGAVDLTDLNNVRNNFGGQGLGDTDADGDIDLTDLNNVRNGFGASSSVAVPEPSSGVFALAAIAIIGIVGPVRLK